jgi:hypothetical protein
MIVSFILIVSLRCNAHNARFCSILNKRVEKPNLCGRSTRRRSTTVKLGFYAMFIEYLIYVSS